MKCPKCNSKIKDNSKYCPRCGEIFKAKDIETFSDIYNLEYLEIYYPNKSKKIESSYLYAIFTFYYAIYQKMYRCAFFTFASLLTLFYIVPRFEYFVEASWGFNFYAFFFLILGCLGIYLYYVFNFDELLLDRRKNQINYIIRNNKDKSSKEIKQLVILDSKGNYLGVIIAIFITIFFIFFTIFN